MRYRFATKRLAIWTSFGICLAFVPPIKAQNSADAKCTKVACYSNFTVTGMMAGGSLSVNDVNNSGTIAGGFTDSSGNIVGFMGTPNGSFTTLLDPQDTGPYFYTSAIGINNGGTVSGLYINSADNAYEGFTYLNGTYSTYVFPGLPAGSETAVSKVTDSGAFCGYIVPNAQPVVWTAFIVTRNGADVTTFQVNSSTFTLCEGMNDLNTTAGSYQDSAGVYHGFVRTPGGTITTIDALGASTIPGSIPCPNQSGIGSTGAGTIVIGINRLGDVSGHFWDTSYNEHGFVLTHSGKFKQIDYPGAYQTAGGGINDSGKMVGHYTDASCNASGFIAQTFWRGTAGRPRRATMSWRAPMPNIQALAEEFLSAYNDGQTVVVPPSAREGGLTLNDAFAVENEFLRLRMAAGRRSVGLKVGYANKAMWRVLKLETLVWAHMYDETVHMAAGGAAELALPHLGSRKIEPEIVFRLRRSLPDAGLDAAAALDAVEWLAVGFEIIECPFPEWQFQPVDFVASFGLHRALVVGEQCPVEPALVPKLVEELPRFKVRLLKNGVLIEEGSGKNSLRSPALCLAELAGALLRQPGAQPLAAGDLVSSGTLTGGSPAVPGELWSVEVDGIPLSGLTVSLR